MPSGIFGCYTRQRAETVLEMSSIYTNRDETNIFTHREFGGKWDVAVAHHKYIGFIKDQTYNLVVEWHY